jgi:hypothetical protein
MAAAMTAKNGWVLLLSRLGVKLQIRVPAN